SARFFMSIGVTDVIGSTPSPLTPESCSPNPRMALSPPPGCAISSPAPARRGRWGLRRTGAAPTEPTSRGRVWGLLRQAIAEAVSSQQAHQNTPEMPRIRHSTRLAATYISSGDGRNSQMEAAMERLEFKCPTTGRRVDIGIETEITSLLRIRDHRVTGKCTACGQWHEWLVRDAYLPETVGFVDYAEPAGFVAH